MAESESAAASDDSMVMEARAGDRASMSVCSEERSEEDSHSLTHSLSFLLLPRFQILLLSSNERTQRARTTDEHAADAALRS